MKIKLNFSQGKQRIVFSCMRAGICLHSGIRAGKRNVYCSKCDSQHLQVCRACANPGQCPEKWIQAC